MSILRTTFTAAAFALAASAASASSVLIQTAGIYQPGSIKIVGPALNETGLASAIEFTAAYGAGSPVTLYAFCVDLFHNVTVGIDNAHDIVTGAGDAQLTVNLPYHTGALTVDSSGALSGIDGTLLTTTQIGEIIGLANLGRGLILTDAADLSNKLTAIQGAIWSVEYPAYSVTAPDATVQAYLDGYVTAASGFAYTGPVAGLFADSGGSQAFVIGVPEPAAWAMMLTGFGLVGLVARRRRLAPIAV